MSEYAPRASVNLLMVDAPAGVLRIHLSLRKRLRNRFRIDGVYASSPATKMRERLTHVSRHVKSNSEKRLPHDGSHQDQSGKSRRSRN